MYMFTLSRWSYRVAPGVGCLAACLLASAPVAAQDRSPVVIQGEVGLAEVISSHHRDVLGFSDAGPCAAVRVHASWTNSFGPRFGAGRCSFSGPHDEVGHLYTISGGLAWRPWLHRVVRLALEAEVGLSASAGVARPLVGGAAGVDFQIIDGLSLGPVLRYQRVFAIAADTPDTDLQLLELALVVGVSAAVLSRPVRQEARVEQAELVAVPAPLAGRAATADVDSDGVPDDSDLCVHDAEGPHADPQRHGCPDLDSDRDGVPDTVDFCVHQPGGSDSDPARAGCPSGDADGDGVPDARDVCRTEPPGLLPDPERPGCPLADRDRDLVPDARDTCPETAGAPRPEVVRNGCPGEVVFEGRRVRLTEPISFDRSHIRGRSSRTMRALRDVLLASPASVRVMIVGRADGEGDAAGRERVGLARAVTVRRWLVEHGIEEARINATFVDPPSITEPHDPACADSVEIWLALPPTR
jgi:Thrombospondin type 3 repeat